MLQNTQNLQEYSLEALKMVHSNGFGMGVGTRVGEVLSLSIL